MALIRYYIYKKEEMEKSIIAQALMNNCTPEEKKLIYKKFMESDIQCAVEYLINYRKNKDAIELKNKLKGE